MRQLAATALLGCSILLANHPLEAQAPADRSAPMATASMASRYARAESFLGRNARKLVYGAEVEPQWMADGRFWYRNRVRGGFEFVLVDPVRGTRATAFDHVRLAAALSVAAETTFAAGTLPFERIRLEDEGRTLRFVSARDREWSCDLSAYRCSAAASPTDLKPDEASSPRWSPGSLRARREPLGAGAGDRFRTAAQPGRRDAPWVRGDARGPR